MEPDGAQGNEGAHIRGAAVFVDENGTTRLCDGDAGRCGQPLDEPGRHLCAVPLLLLARGSHATGWREREAYVCGRYREGRPRSAEGRNVHAHEVSVKVCSFGAAERGPSALEGCLSRVYRTASVYMLLCFPGTKHHRSAAGNDRARSLLTSEVLPFVCCCLCLSKTTA